MRYAIFDETKGRKLLIGYFTTDDVNSFLKKVYMKREHINGTILPFMCGLVIIGGASILSAYKA